jgi:hypothetical protein
MSSASIRQRSAPDDTSDEMRLYNLKAEMSVIGSMLIDNGRIPVVAPILEAKHFFRDSHQIIYRAIRDLHDLGNAIDGITLVEELSNRGQFEKVGGDDAIREILEAPPHAENAEYYAKIVRQKWVSRAILEANHQGIRDFESKLFDCDQLLERSNRRNLEISAAQYQEEPTEEDLGYIGMVAFSEATYAREWLVKRLMVKGKPGVIGGPKKSLKTSLVVDLAVSLGGAIPFLGQFDVPRPVKTLVISGESGEATIQETMRRICRSKGIWPADLEGFVFWRFKLPKLGSVADVEALGKFIRDNGIEVTIIDPLYLCLMSGGRTIDTSNLFEVGPLLKTVCDICLEAGSTPFLVHHYRKNRMAPFDAPDMEDLAFAGIQEFARQWILLGRRERFEPGSGEHKLWLSVGGSDGHSGEWSVDVTEGTTDEDFRDRGWSVSIGSVAETVAKIKEDASKVKAENAIERAKALQTASERKAHGDAENLLSALEKSPGGINTQNRLGRDLGLSGAKVGKAVKILLDQGRIKPIKKVEFTDHRGGNQKYPGYEFVTHQVP